MEESDTEELYLLSQEYNRYHSIQRYTEVISSYTLDEFKTHFRISRASLQTLVEDLKTRYLSLSGRAAIPLEKALLMTIWTLSNQESFRTIADRFGIRKGVAHTVIIKVCKLLYGNMQKYIVWPKGQEAIKNLAKFNKLRGENSFPNVFGCVDGTHIPIPRPQEDNSYFNRKGSHSVITQVICDSNKGIINVSCGWPGSFHDARVWKSSKIYQKLSQDAANWMPHGTVLLGDSAYPVAKFLMVPFRDNGHLTNQQKRFNIKLSSTRVIVEHAIGRLKGLFRRLKFLNTVKLEYCKYFIIASCILNNISIGDGVSWCEEEEEIPDEMNYFEGRENIQGSELRLEIMRRIC